MSKKGKDWLTVALGISVLAKGVYGLLNDEEDIEDIELSEGGRLLKEEIEGKSKYADMEEAEVITKEKENDKE